MSIPCPPPKLIPIFLGLLFPPLIAANEIQATPINIKDLQQVKVRLAAPLVKGVTFKDVQGKHLLLLTKRSGPSKSMTDPHREERHELKAIQFAKTAKGWVEEWVITDHVDCPSLDSEANFYLDQVSITDVNKDGHAEVSVPYNLFCGGGVDPRIIKIVMRTKRQKFALRGWRK